MVSKEWFDMFRALKQLRTDADKTLIIGIARAVCIKEIVSTQELELSSAIQIVDKSIAEALNG